MALNMVTGILKKTFFEAARSTRLSNRALQFHGFTSKLKNYCQRKEQYYTRLAHAKDHDAIMRLICDTYLKSEPSIVNLGLSGRDIPALNHIMRQGMEEGMTIVAVRHEDDAVVGAAINTGSCPWCPEQLLHFADCCQCGPVQDLLKFYAYISMKPQLWQKYSVLKIFECTYVTVTNECQGHGLAKRLIRDSWYFARDCGYRLFRIDCTSRYTAKIAQSFGWERVCSIPFADYAPNGEPVFRHVQEPHTTVDVFVDQVRFCKDYCSPYPVCKKRKKNSTIP